MSDRKEQIQIVLEALRLHDANNTCMSVEQCSKFLGVHKNTVLNRIHAGEIKTNLIGRVHSIPKLQFLDKIIERIKMLCERIRIFF